MDLPRQLTVRHLRTLRDYWLRARGKRAMPARRDIDPLDVPRLLPYLVLTEVHHAPLRFRYRLIGTAVTELAGRDATGRWLDAELYGENSERMLEAFRHCVAERAPVARREPIRFGDKEWLVIEALMLPLGVTDDRVVMVLSGVGTVPRNRDNAAQTRSRRLDWTGT